MGMETTLELAQTVAALLSVFHNAVDLMKQITKKTKKKKKSEDAMKQKWLQESLEAGELQISQRYSQYQNEFGEKLKFGDDQSRDQIQHIAILMQGGLLRSLQLYNEYKDAVLDVDKFQADAYTFRRDALTALDELRSRLQAQSPGPATSMFSQLVPTSPTVSTPGSELQPFMTPSVPEEDSLRRMSRLFSMRSKPHRRTSSSSSTISNMIVRPNLNWLGPVQAEPEKFELSAGDIPQHTPPPYLENEKSPLVEPDIQMLHPALAKQTAIDRHASTSTQSSDRSYQTHDSSFSMFSDEKIPVLYEEEPDSPFPDACEIAAALPPDDCLHVAPLNIRPKSTPTPSLSTAPWSAFPSPTKFAPQVGNLGSVIAPDCDPHIHGQSSNLTIITPPAPTRAPPTAPTINRERSSTALSGSSTPSSHRDSLTLRSASVTSKSSSTTTTTMGQTLSHLTSQPEKKNNYHGFCKGSWTIRTDWRKGLVIQTLPSGLYSHEQVFQCKSCQFRGKIFGSKKPYSTDPGIKVDKETGVRYRWIFLAKSHAKVGHSQKDGEVGYGCLFCSLAGVQSGIYGSEGLLFGHIVGEHGVGMTEEMMGKARCVVGRIAEKSEDFDVNIP